MSNPEGEDRYCPVCGGERWHVIYDLGHIKKSLCLPGRIARCFKCGMLFKIQSGGDHHLDVYGEEYSNAQNISAYMAGKSTYSLFTKVLQEVLAQYDKNTPRPQRLLDVGTGLGTILEVASRLGLEAEGIDVNKQLVENACKRGLKVQCLAVESFDATGAFDVITMMDFIEHVSEPIKVLRSVHRMLKPGGSVVVYTPNHRGAVVELSKLLNCIGFPGPLSEIFGSNHLSFFDDRTLAFALNAVGFEIYKVWFSPYLPLVMRKGMPLSLFSSIAVSLIELFGVPLKRVFRMMYYARKVL